MKIFLLFLLVLHSSLSLAIINGTEDIDNKFKNIVKIRGISLCTGTVINPYLILTAAHCTDNGRIQLEIYSYETEREHLVHKVIPHPTAIFHKNQSTLLKGHDISLIVLKDPINLGENDYMRLMGKKKQSFYNNKAKVSLLGIGIYDDQIGWPSQIKTLKETVISKIPYWRCGGNQTKTFSTHHVARSGDSGGPAFIYERKDDSKVPIQIGIISKEIIFDYENEYLPKEEWIEVDCKNKSIHTKITPFLRWIEKETGYAPSMAIEKTTKEVIKKFNL